MRRVTESRFEHSPLALGKDCHSLGLGRYHGRAFTDKFSRFSCEPESHGLRANIRRKRGDPYRAHRRHVEMAGRERKSERGIGIR
jgi:hypothetical protein